jgi:uncharacterized membrane-anchored protein YitT (DUF2179 family)
MTIKRHIKDAISIIIGIFSAGMGLKGFLLSSHFIDGGVTGISMLVADISGIPLAVLIFVINVPFLILGLKQMGMEFAVKSALAILGLSLVISFVHFPDVTPDKLLTAIFGGLFIGVGIGFAMRGGAVLDGTEIAAVLVSRKAQIVKVSDVILILNVVIFGVATFYLGIEPALYSILTYLAASKMIDFILNGIEQYTGVTIISDRNEEIHDAIINKLGKGVTIYQGKKGFGSRGLKTEERDIIFTVTTRLEIPTLKNTVMAIDPKAFIIQQSIDDTTGGLLKKKALH